MRLIQQFMRMAARMMGLRENGQFRELDEEIRLAYDSVLKTDYNLISGYDQNDWDKFKADHQAEELEIAGILQMIEGEALADQGKKSEAMKHFNVALELLLQCDATLKTYSFERVENINKLKAYTANA